MISPIFVENVSQMYIKISYTFHRTPDRQSRFITKVHDLLGQPSYFPLFVGVLCLYWFCYALFFLNSSIAIILKRRRKLVNFLLLSYRCIVTINVLWLFPTVPCVGLQHVIVVFPDHTHLLFAM